MQRFAFVFVKETICISLPNQVGGAVGGQARQTSTEMNSPAPLIRSVLSNNIIKHSEKLT